MEIGVRVASQGVPLAALFRVHEPPRGHPRHHVEVQPPHPGREPDPDDRGGPLGEAEVTRHAHADRDDRLAEGDDQDQAVALGEVGRHQLPALCAEEVGPGHVEGERQTPQADLRGAVQERRADEDPDADGGAGRQTDHRSTQLRLVAAGQHEEADVGGTDDRVREREGQTEVAEGLGNAEGGHQQARHRREHHAADGTLLRVHDAREPRVADP